MRLKLKGGFQLNVHISLQNTQNSWFPLKFVSWELVTEGYQGRPIKCPFHEFHLKLVERLVILYVIVVCTDGRGRFVWILIVQSIPLQKIRQNLVRITQWFEFSCVYILFKLIFFLNFVSREVFEYGGVRVRFTLPLFTLSAIEWTLSREVFKYCGDSSYPCLH